MSKRIPKETLEKIVELYEENLPNNKIARQLGISSTTVGRFLESEGLKNKYNISEETKKEIINQIKTEYENFSQSKTFTTNKEFAEQHNISIQSGGYLLTKETKEDKDLSKIREFRLKKIREKTGEQRGKNNLGRSYGRKKPIEQYLKLLGDRILEINKEKEPGERKQLLSTSLIKTIISPSFYVRFARDYESRKALLKKIHPLDPKYESIKLQHQIQNRTKPTSLRELPDGRTEENIIIQVLCDYLDYLDKTSQGGRVPKGSIKSVINELNKALEENGLEKRTELSIKYHVHKILHGEYKHNHIFGRGSPEPSSIDEVIEGTIKTVDKKDTKIIVKTDKKKQRQYLKFSTEGHKALIAYLTDPNNYKKILGEDVELIGVDLSDSETDEEYLKRIKETSGDLESISEGYKDVVEFVDNWLRCDLVYKRADQGFVVVEVKQNAVNTKRFNNADKGFQQVFVYCAGLEGNVELHNKRNEDNPFNSIIEGYLIAYLIQDDIKEILNNKSDKDAIEIPKKTVDNYLKGNPKISTSQEEFEIRRENFQEFKDLIEEERYQKSASWDKVPFTIYLSKDPKEEDIIIHREDGKTVGIYTLNRAKTHKPIIAQKIKAGIIQENKADKYFHKRFEKELAEHEKVEI